MESKKVTNDLSYYLGLRYPVTVHTDPEGGFVAEIEELPGCMTQAETLDDVFAAIEDARQAWIEAAYEDGQDIPLPRGVEAYSGKFLVRIPRSLHRALARAAKQEGVSLNQHVTSLLAGAVQTSTVEAHLSLILTKVGVFAPHIQEGIFGYEGDPLAWAQWVELPGQKALVR